MSYRLGTVNDFYWGKFIKDKLRFEPIWAHSYLTSTCLEIVLILLFVSDFLFKILLKMKKPIGSKRTLLNEFSGFRRYFWRRFDVQ